MVQKDNEHLLIRKMAIKDLDKVYEIEKESYAHPWDKLEFVKELKGNKFAHYFVCLLDGKIVSFLGVWIVFEEAHITNIAVSPNYRKIGLGSMLIDFSVSFAKNKNAKRIVLEVRVSNKEAINLYIRKGFRVTSIKKNYYIDNFEDAYEMIKELD